MREKTLKWTTRILLAVAGVFTILYFYLPKIHAWEIEKQEVQTAWNEYADSEIQMNHLEIREPKTGEESIKGLRLRIPEGILADDIKISKDDLTQTLKIEIPHTDGSYFQNDPVTGSSDSISGLFYMQGKKTDVIEITLDQVYELDIERDEKYYYFNFVKPHEIYDKIVVIDAGHGGNDPGANRQGIMEKDIDLAILLELKELFENSKENIHVYYTRTDDSNPTHEQRVGLANKVNADLFISIHNNSTKSGRVSSISGTEVMFSKSQEGDFTSENLAALCMEELTLALNSRDRGLIDGDNIYIVKNSEVPVALVEIGFMTNKEELKLLNSKEYQKKAAEALYKAIVRAFEEKEQE